MTVLIKFLLICLLFWGALMVLSYIRLSKVDQTIWHLDPDAINYNYENNSILLNYANNGQENFDIDVNSLFNHLNKIIINDKCKKVFGGINFGLITYECRSKVFGFPDYVSISFKELEIDKSAISIFSRSRFGKRDFGKNKQRIQKWVTELKKSI